MNRKPLITLRPFGKFATEPIRLLLACESRPAIPRKPFHRPWEQTFMSDDDPVRVWLEDLGDSDDPAEAIHLAMDHAPSIRSFP